MGVECSNIMMKCITLTLTLTLNISCISCNSHKILGSDVNKRAILARFKALQIGTKNRHALQAVTAIKVSEPSCPKAMIMEQGLKKSIFTVRSDGIQTDRLLLRAARLSDLDSLHTIFCNDEVMKFWYVYLI